MMVFETFIRYASLAVGLKPSAMECEARLRGLYRIIFSQTISPRLWNAKPACAGESGVCIHRPLNRWFPARGVLIRQVACASGAVSPVSTSYACSSRALLCLHASSGSLHRSDTTMTDDAVVDCRLRIVDCRLPLSATGSAPALTSLRRLSDAPVPSSSPLNAPPRNRRGLRPCSTGTPPRSARPRSAELAARPGASRDPSRPRAAPCSRRAGAICARLPGTTARRRGGISCSPRSAARRVRSGGSARSAPMTAEGRSVWRSGERKTTDWRC